MEVICSNNRITIRLLEKNNKDIVCLYNWLNNKNVYEFYGDSNEKSFTFVKQKYENKIKDNTTYPCIIEYNKNNIGYVQFYSINNKNYELTEEQFANISNKSDKVFAIDIFIAELEYINKGLGTEIIKLLNKTLFEKYNVDVIVIDPKVNNSRAIACYKKCGFKECFIAKKREEKDGIKYDNLIMKIEK